MDFNRINAEEVAKKESARADMKQHADKLIQGFEKLNESQAKRAVWELVQNACDLSDNCEIVIDFSNNNFSFSHNGKPFTSKTLISLIKQVSSKSSENDDEVGIFGTGFITTHSFGKKFILNSILKEDGFNIDIKDFLIDRCAKNSEELLSKLEEQQANVYKLIREGSILESPYLITKFSYISEYETDKMNIIQAEKNLHHYIPLVLALNQSLKSVKVIASDGSVSNYKKGDEENKNDIFIIPIFKNDKQINVFCLKSEDYSIQVILPLTEFGTTKTFDDLIAKLFVFFPLIGTENWGCNFIIHSKFFAPTEPRNGIHIKSKNEQTQGKEETNRNIIERASTMIFNFLDCYVESLSNPINLALVNFDTITNSELTNIYYKELKKKWVEKLKNLKLIEKENGRGIPAEMFFLSSSLLKEDSFFDSIYEIIAMFWENEIPKKEIAKKWTEIINGWEDSTIRFITINMLVNKIQEQINLLKFNEKTLHNLYQYMIKYNETNVFDEYKILPNIKGEFAKKGGLRLPINIDKNYIQISDIIIPEVPKQFVKDNFMLGLDYGNYNRKKLSEDINTKILILTKELTVENNKLLDKPILNGLITLCCIFPSENTQSTRRQIMPKICDFYNVEFKEQIIANIEDEKFDYDYTPFRGLIKNFILDIVQKSINDASWVDKNLTFLKNCISIIASHKDIKDIIEALPIFPNQNLILSKQIDLLVEKDFPKTNEDSELLKKIYSEILQDIRNKLVLKDFAEYLNHKNEQTGSDLASKIELEMKNNGSFEDIVNHPNKSIIFQIIQKITNEKEWASLFTAIDDKKAIIMMAKISDAELKNDLFAIIGLDDKNKISLLGELSKNPELVRIIELGKIAVENENRNIADLDFKKKIGVHIENLIRSKIELEVENFSIQINEQQGGQDIVVIIENKIVYFIEVKSRWDSRNSITMSNLQIRNATKNKNNYSLCCVDMCDYNPVNSDRYRVNDINDIIERIKFINDIGFKIEPLISNALSAESNEDDVKLTDEYRAIIPQAVVKTGMELYNFVNYLINHLGITKK